MAETLIPDLDANRRRTRTYDATNTDQVLRAVIASLVPTGTVLPTLSDGDESDDFKLLNGQWLFKAEFTRLYSRLQGRVEETTEQFRLPDLRSRTVFGAGGDVGLGVAALGGAHQIVLTTAQMPAHSHTVSDPGHTHAFSAAPHEHDAAVVGATTSAAGGDRPTVEAGQTSAVEISGTVVTSPTGVTVDSAGSGEAIDILPPVIGVFWMIKT